MRATGREPRSRPGPWIYLIYTTKRAAGWTHSSSEVDHRPEARPASHYPFWPHVYPSASRVPLHTRTDLSTALCYSLCRPPRPRTSTRRRRQKACSSAYCSAARARPMPTKSGWGYSSVAELVEFDKSLHKRCACCPAPLGTSVRWRRSPQHQRTLEPTCAVLCFGVRRADLTPSGAGRSPGPSRRWT